MRKIIFFVVFTSILFGTYFLTCFVSSSFSRELEITEIENLSTHNSLKWENPQVEIKHHFAANNCTSCHYQVEHIRAENSGMMQEILEIAQKAGAPGNDCIVCHGGNPTGTREKTAHEGIAEYFKTNPGPKNFYPEPGSPWINENTCGLCHIEHVKTQFTSLMFTEAGKIQGTLWGFGGMNGYNHDIGNYDVQEVEVHERIGSTV